MPPVESEGPALEALLHRLAECPPDFLAEPRLGERGVIEVAAVVADLLRALGGAALTPDAAAVFRPARQPAKHRNRLRAVLITAWLLHDDWFRERERFAAPAQQLLAGGVGGISTVTDGASGAACHAPVASPA